MIGFTLALLICGFIYNGLISIVYFNRKRVKNIENRVYRILLILNIFGVVLEAISFLTAIFLPIDAIFSEVVARLYLIYILFWVIGFTLYTFFISNVDRKIMKKYLDNRKKWWTYIILVSSGFLIPLIFLPLYFANDGTYAYTYGPCTDFLIIIFIVGLIIDLINILSNLQIIRSKKILPLVVFVCSLIILVAVRIINPGIQLITTTLTFIVILMYFTIENPDLDLIQKVNISKDIATKASNSTLLVLNNISKKLKLSLNEYDISKINSEKEFQKLSKEVIGLTDKLIEISLIETGNLELHNENYDVKEMFESVKSFSKTIAQDNKIEVDVSLAKNIPKVLYGDVERLKQILLIILSKSIPNKNGTIGIKVTCLNAGSLCRLKIYVNSSFEEMKTGDNLNDRMNNLDYEIASNLANLMYGKIELISKKELLLSLSQRKVKNYDKEKTNIIVDKKRLSSKTWPNNKILFVDDNQDKIKEFELLVQRYKIEVDTAKSFQECIDLLDMRKEYDIIFIDEMMPDINGIDVIELLKKTTRISDHKLPPIVYVTSVDYDKRKEYLEHGVYYCIDKPINKYELDDTLNKILK